MKIYSKILIVLFGIGMLYSCSLDFKPNNQILGKDAYTRIEDCEIALNGLYSMVRSGHLGNVQLAEVMADDVKAPKWTNNLYPLEVRRFEGREGTSLFGSIWLAKYTIAANASSLINNMNELHDPNDAKVQQITAEASFMRALSHFELLRLYAGRYNSATASTDLGIPIVKEASREPKARNSVQEVLSFIFEDLNKARIYFEANTPSTDKKYISLDAVNALKSRIYLYMGEYTSVIRAADSVIASPRTYSYNMSAAELSALWIDDNSTKDIIMQLAINTSEGISSFSFAESMYLSNKNIPGKLAKPQFIPGSEVRALFGTLDRRTNLYFLKTYNMAPETTDGQEQIDLVAKYRGNPVYGTTDLVNQFKIFRFSEVILNKMEALYHINQVQASALLDDFKANRIDGYTPQGLTGSALLQEIKNERRRELAFEGFRFHDLKRWDEGFNRTADKYTNTADVISVTAADYHWTLPIPVAERNVNKIIEQNPGY